MPRHFVARGEAEKKRKEVKEGEWGIYRESATKERGKVRKRHNEKSAGDR